MMWREGLSYSCENSSFHTSLLNLSFLIIFNADSESTAVLSVDLRSSLKHARLNA